MTVSLVFDTPAGRQFTLHVAVEREGAQQLWTASVTGDGPMASTRFTRADVLGIGAIPTASEAVRKGAEALIAAVRPARGLRADWGEPLHADVLGGLGALLEYERPCRVCSEPEDLHGPVTFDAVMLDGYDTVDGGTAAAVELTSERSRLETCERQPLAWLHVAKLSTADHASGPGRPSGALEIHVTTTLGALHGAVWVDAEGRLRATLGPTEEP